MKKIKTWLRAAYKSKTFWLGHLLAIAGIVQMNLPGLRASIPPEAYGWVSVTVALIVYALRAVTTEGINNK